MFLTHYLTSVLFVNIVCRVDFMVNCRYDLSRRCFHNLCCSIFDRSTGNVTVCELFRGGRMFSRRRVVELRS